MRSLIDVLGRVTETGESSRMTRWRGSRRGRGGASSSARAAAEDSGTAGGRRARRGLV